MEGDNLKLVTPTGLLKIGFSEETRNGMTIYKKGEEEFTFERLRDGTINPVHLTGKLTYSEIVHDINNAKSK